MNNTIYSLGHEERYLPDSSHKKARVFVIDKGVYLAFVSASAQHKIPAEHILNPPAPAAVQAEQYTQPATITTTQNTAPNSSANADNQNIQNSAPAIPTSPNYLTPEAARITVNRAFDEIA